jgi:Leu/Phe-tRNA-protein transferase
MQLTPLGRLKLAEYTVRMIVHTPGGPRTNIHPTALNVHREEIRKYLNGEMFAAIQDNAFDDLIEVCVREHFGLTDAILLHGYTLDQIRELGKKALSGTAEVHPEAAMIA